MTLKSLSRLRSIGGSLVVTIPKEVVKQKFLDEGVLVEIEVEKVEADGFGKFKDLKSFTDEDRMGDRF